MIRVLLLSPYPAEALPRLPGAKVTVADELLTVERCRDHDLILSYGYRRIIDRDVVREYGGPRGKIVNLHLSFLPWNRGADPNFWSWIDGTPKGVSLHMVDAGIDTGPIVLVRGVRFHGQEHTLATTYADLRRAAVGMIQHSWPAFRGRLAHGWPLLSIPQPAGGSYHKTVDKESLFARLSAGWDTPVGEVQELGRQLRRGDA